MNGRMELLPLLSSLDEDTGLMAQTLMTVSKLASMRISGSNTDRSSTGIPIPML